MQPIVLNKAACTTLALTGLLALGLSAARAEAPKMAPEMMPKPTQEHAWLQQMVGNWNDETEAVMEPGKAPVKSKGTENVRSVGGFWTVNDIKGTLMNQPMSGQMTLGYDADAQKYVGTWVDSMTGKMMNYEGQLDASGKALVLESEGTCPMNPGKVMKFRDTLEMKDKDHKTFTSAIQGEDGQWMTMMTSKAVRTK